MLICRGTEPKSLGFAYCRTLRVTVAVCAAPPPLPVMVMVWFPSVAFLPTLTVMVDFPEPGAAMELGLKVTVWAGPCPVADKVIAELKPLETVVVRVAVPELLRATLIVVGTALMVKFGLLLVTVRETVVVSTVLPEVPLTVMWYVPVAVDEATVSVMIEVPAPVIEVGLKPTVTPEGWPVADNETAESKPPVTVLVIVEVRLAPCATVTEAGDAERLKPAPDELPASAVIKPLPLGLPHPVAKS